MEFWDAFVNVIAIIAIIGVGAFVMVFIGDLLLNVIDNKNGIFFKKRNRKKQAENIQTYTATEEKVQTPEPEPIVVAQPKEPVSTIDYDKAYEEEVALKSKYGIIDEVKPIETEEDVDDFFSTISSQTKDNSKDKEEIFSMIDEVKAKVLDDEANLEVNAFDDLLKKATGGKSFADYSKELESYSINNIVSDAREEVADDAEEIGNDTEESNAEEEILDMTEEVATVEEKQEEVAEPVVEVKQEVVAEEKTDEKELEISKLKEELERLAKELEIEKNKPVEVPKVQSVALLTVEAYEKRLEMLDERLKVTKKEYKRNAKEFRPLDKVRKTLEKDKTKLRRKEAIVARKKVELYGVNNYVDIDQEKAEKLSNELELLDGLRLSVQHCEDVMNSNKDRFPILEHTDKILKEQIAIIEADIAETKTNLELAKNKK